MALPGGSTREQPAHLVSGKPSAPNLENGREWHRRGTETNSHRRVEGGKLLQKLGTLRVVVVRSVEDLVVVDFGRRRNLVMSVSAELARLEIFAGG
jgi:hypothetical protein